MLKGSEAIAKVSGTTVIHTVNHPTKLNITVRYLQFLNNYKSALRRQYLTDENNQPCN